MVLETEGDLPSKAQIMGRNQDMWAADFSFSLFFLLEGSTSDWHALRLAWLDKGERAEWCVCGSIFVFWREWDLMAEFCHYCKPVCLLITQFLSFFPYYGIESHSPEYRRGKNREHKRPCGGPLWNTRTHQCSPWAADSGHWTITVWRSHLCSRSWPWHPYIPWP